MTLSSENLQPSDSVSQEWCLSLRAPEDWKEEEDMGWEQLGIGQCWSTS